MSEPLPPLSVALLALPETTPGAIYGLHEVLSAVGTTWSALTGEPEAAARRILPRIVSLNGREFVSRAGAKIAVEKPLDEVETADVIIATDLATDLGADPRGSWAAEAAWLRDRFAEGATACSVCTGSVFLAEAGLLDGAEATTHWAAAPVFRDCYPQVRLQSARILCAAGPEHRIVTAGGASSWTDLALYLIGRFCGEEEATRMAKAFLIGDRSEGQLPFSAMTRPRQHADAAIAGAQAWIAEHYCRPNPVAGMALCAKLPDRTFARRFRAATGFTPVEYVQVLRVEEAKQLLETTAEPTDAVAMMVGYEDPAFFRRMFKRRTGVTPARYRQRFQRFQPSRSIDRRHREDVMAGFSSARRGREEERPRPAS